MLQFEYNTNRNSVEIHGDREGLMLLAKRIMGLVNKDPGSYTAAGQGNECKPHGYNELADYYLILLREDEQQT